MSQKNIHKYVFGSPTTKNFPIIKPLIDEAWFCQLQKGSMVVNYNYKEYTITAKNEVVNFLVVDGMHFTIVSGSKNFLLQIYAVGHDCLSLIYPSLGAEINSNIVFPQLITTQQMPSSINLMIQNSFEQIENILTYRNDLMEFDTIVRLTIATCLHFFHNGISIWKRNYYSFNNREQDLHNYPQSFQIMHKLSLIFDEQEAFLHRDISYFANRLNISVRYFFKVCMIETGMSPKQFINDVIISEIKHTLLDTNLSLKQISIKYDFSDQTSFTQYFKRNVGVTPTEFRSFYR